MKVYGLVDKPRTFSLEELMQLAPLEERIYRHRCVEAWSIVVPWVGYSLSALLKEVSPQPKAKYRSVRKLLRYGTDERPGPGRNILPLH